MCDTTTILCNTGYIFLFKAFTYVLIITVAEPLNIVGAYDTLRRTHPEFTDADMRFEMLNFYCTVSIQLHMYTGSKNKRVLTVI